MTHTLSIPDGAYILVADGNGGRLFSASKKGDALSLTSVDDLELSDPKHKGPSGTRPPEQTGSQTEEATFAKHAADALYLMAHAGKFSDLVVIADPQTLGQMRGIFHKEITERIVRELPKTLTNLSKHELEQHLSKG